MKYLVNRDILYPPPHILDRLRAGERIPMDARELFLRRPGDLVDDIPEESLDRLLTQGFISEMDSDEEDLHAEV